MSEITFDDEKIVFGSNTEDVLSALERDGSPGGIGRSGLKEEKLGVVAEVEGVGSECGPESIGAESVSVAGDGEELETHGVESSESAGIGGFFDEDGVAGIEEHVEDLGEAVLAAGSDEELGGGGKR